MRWQVVAQAVAVFAATNLDDLLMLLIFVAEARATGTSRWRVVAGQYLGFALILVVALLVTAGVGWVPASQHRWLGLLPLGLGIRAGVLALRHRSAVEDHQAPSGVPSIALLTFAGGGDNVGAYVPIFAADSAHTIVVYVVVFLVCLAVWCALGQILTAHHVIRDWLSRWSRIILPIVLITIGGVILSR